jgi:hypothetical protein
MAVKCYLTGQIVSDSNPYGFDTICESCVEKYPMIGIMDIPVEIRRCIYSWESLTNILTEKVYV